MWRSWVDKINTINKVPEESHLSKEALQKQEQQKIKLLDIWRTCTDLLTTEQECTNAFKLSMIPLMEETYQQFGADFTLNALSDVRSFIVMLTKELINGIRNESKTALMNNLRSKEMLYSILSALQIFVSWEQKSVITIMLQQRIPAIITKLFRSAMLLPESYYDEDMLDLMSMDQVRTVMVSILKQFVQSKSVLMTDDILFTIVSLMTVRPSDDSKDSKMPPYLLWKLQVMDILKSINMDSEICQYLHHHRCITLMVESWKSSTPLDHQEILFTLNLLHFLFFESTQIQFYGLMNELKEAKGYQTLRKVLTVGPYNESTTPLKMEIVNRLVGLSYFGKINLVSSVPVNLPYQHADFSRPQPNGNIDKLVKDTSSSGCLLDSLLLAHTTEIPTTLQIKLFNGLKEIIMADLCNYFILECIDIVPQLIENMENFDVQIQKGTMELLKFIMVDLNFVPLKELAVLSLHFQSSSSGNMVYLICQSIIELLKKTSSTKYLTALQDAGLLNIMSLMLSDITQKLNNLENDEFLKNTLDHFDTIVDCIIAMTSNATNVAIFQKTYKGNLFDLFQSPQARIGTLKLFENLLIHSFDIIDDTSITNQVNTLFSKVMEAIQSIPRNELDFRLETLVVIKRIFASHPSAKDIFRNIGGYVGLVSMLVALEGAFEEPQVFVTQQSSKDSVVSKIIKMIQVIFAVLAESMHHHQVNKKYFIDNIGYESIQKSIQLTGAFGIARIPEQIFGALFAFAVEDESIHELFVEPVTTDNNALKIDIFKRIESTLVQAKVANPEITLVIFHLQQLISSSNTQLARAVLCGLYALAQESRRNQIIMNRCGLGLILLERIFPKDPSDRISSVESDISLEIIQKLMTMGVSYDELKYMFQRFDVNHPENTPGLLDLILTSASRSRWPNFIQFNVNSSLQIPQFAQFPPVNSGYTFLSWIHIEKLEGTLSYFSIWDDSTLIFRIYVDAQTKTLRVHNHTSKRDFIFKSFEVRIGYWYYICLVHNKSRVKSSSMSMYVNGAFIESIHCSYPPISNNVLKAAFGEPNEKQSEVIWNLGPTYLIQDTIEKETINLLFNLGARYKSLFQDQIRQFQTHEASSSVLLYPRSLSKYNRRETEEASLAKMMKNTKFQKIPDSKILLAFFACNTLIEGEGTGLTFTGVSESTMVAIKDGFNSSHQLIVNSANPKLESSVHMSKNTGYLMGDSVVAYPFGLDESMWKIGGCSVALKLIEKSTTSEMLLKSSTLLFEIIRYSWRNSEEMEKGHGYEILAFLLKQKRELITIELLELMLVFIGKNPNSLEDSIINNPLAYRYVILNLEIWKKTPLAVQKVHLDQFILFLNTSKMKHFNSKRLPKIHLVKKVLLAFKMNVYAKELVPHLIESLKVIMIISWTTESIRSVGTFLASTITDDTQNKLNKPEEKSSESFINLIDFESSSNDTENTSDTKNYSNTKREQMRTIVLEMLHDILCDETNGSEYISKFAATITNRWILLFFKPDIDSISVILAARIFARICIIQGNSYVQKFRSMEGFTILRNLLPAHYKTTQLYEILVLMMFGIDISNYPLASQFDIHRLRQAVDGKKVLIPDILSIMMAMWDESRRNMELPDSKLSNIPLLNPIVIGKGSESKQLNDKESKKDSKNLQTQLSNTIDGFIQFFNELYNCNASFREAFNNQEAVDGLVQILFQSICAPHNMTAEDELASKDVLLTNVDIDYIQSPISSVNSPIDTLLFFDGRNKSLDGNNITIDGTLNTGNKLIKRGGTSSLMTKTSPHVLKRGNTTMTRLKFTSWNQNSFISIDTSILQNPMFNSILKFVVDICAQSIVDPRTKNLNGLDLVFSAFPPSFHDHQLIFESFLFVYILQELKSSIQLETKLLSDPQVLSNIARFLRVASDAVIQGRFKDGGVEQIYDILATILENLHTDEYQKKFNGKDINIFNIYGSFNRMILLRISDLEDENVDTEKILIFLDHCIHHQKVILSSKNMDMEFLKCFCYHLYYFLLSPIKVIKDSAANLWKLLMLQKPESVDTIINIRIKGVETDDLIEGFKRILEMDLESFYRWLDSRKVELNILFSEHISKSWEEIVTQENKDSKEAFKNYVTKRINKLKKMDKREGREKDVITDYEQKSTVWLQNICEVEMSRFIKALQDFDGHQHFIQSEWNLLSADLMRERALWEPEEATDINWRLDYTEGPDRMRKRLQGILNDDLNIQREAVAAVDESSSSIQVTVNNKTANRKSGLDIDNELNDDSNFSNKDDEKSTIEDDDSIRSNTTSSNFRENEEEEEEEEEEKFSYEEDKNRKVLRLLEPEDIVMDVYNVSQIAGLDACESLLLLCKNNIYLIDNFFQLNDGEVVEIWDVPKEERDQYLLLIAQAAGMETEVTRSAGDLHACRKWSNAELRDVFKRRFLFRDVALEIFFNDGRNALITVNLSEIEDLYSKLVSRVSNHEDSGGAIFNRESENYGNTSSSSTFKLSSIFGTSTLQGLTQRWERKEITNFQYLMYLNAIAGRSYNDLTQYPVFPWILADYTSEELDLNDPKTFRDLTRPMGAQTEERRLEFMDRYKQWGETDDPTPAFHYGTHYSSAMIVCSFLIRLEPFTQHFLKLQGGTFDHADRLFDSVGKAWESASEKNMGDVRELIPEFFYLPEFLTNANNFNFGVKQGTGEVIDSVGLPPWANDDPKIFIQRHREALESDYVSANLHHWIDLIFGYKQLGQAAIDSLNVFHYVSYEGAIDLDSITNIVEKTAMIGMINNFGQTPRQLFKKPHPVRSSMPVKNASSKGYFVFQDHLEKLVQSLIPIRNIKQEVQYMNIYNDKLGVTTCQQLLVPSDGSKYIEWGYSDNSLRLYSTDSGKLLKVFENMHIGYISLLSFLDSHTFITGGTDNLVNIWEYKDNKNISITLLACLRGHDSIVTSIAASKSYSVIITGSKDKTAIIWDFNSKQYIRSLSGHETGVNLVQINDTTGDIVTCSGNIIYVWTINGDLYLSKSICPNSESILSCIYYQQKISEWYNKDLIITGHKNGVIKFWFKQLHENEWDLALAHQLLHYNRNDGSVDNSDVISLFISNTRKTLFTGNRLGHVYSFVMPDTPDTYHFQREDRCKECMSCGKAFSVLERKIHCRTCGGIYCSSCISSLSLMLPDKSAKFCKHCYERLAPVCNQY